MPEKGETPPQQVTVEYRLLSVSTVVVVHREIEAGCSRSQPGSWKVETSAPTGRSSMESSSMHSVAITLIFTLSLAATGAVAPPGELIDRACGSCHRDNLSTSVPAALAAFDLGDPQWAGGLTAEQWLAFARRARATDKLTATEREVVIAWVREVSGEGD